MAFLQNAKMDAVKIENSRQFTRYSLIRYLRIFDKKSPRLIGYLKDISEGGFLLISETAKRCDSYFTLRMDFSKVIEGVKAVTFKAKSIWCKPKAPHPNFYETGFSFYPKLAKKELKVIQALIHAFGYQAVFESEAVRYHHGEEGYNCAQAILKAHQHTFQVDEAMVEAYRNYDRGRAKDGVCGALFGAKQLLGDIWLKKEIEECFVSEVGSRKCEDICELGTLSCIGSIYIADQIVQNIIKKYL